MGWLIVICIKPMLERLDTMGMMWLALGGLFYSVGAIFCLWKSMP